MRIARLLFLMIGCAALTTGTAYADPSSAAPQQTSSQGAANTASGHPHDADHASLAGSGNRQKDGKLSLERRDKRQVSGKDHSRGPAPATKNRTTQVPRSRESSSSANAMHLHQPGSDSRTGSAKSESIQHDTVNRAQRVQSENVVRSTAPSLNNVRHRGANPAVIGGSANSYGRNPGMINGTSVHRRP
jgi:hypothetical protein